MGLLRIITGINPNPALCNPTLQRDLGSCGAEKHVAAVSAWRFLMTWYFKATLVICGQSNSWSTPQSSLNYPLNPQRHSDMCAPRQPLSPLYDEPCSPEVSSLDEAGALVSGSPVSPDPTRIYAFTRESRRFASP